MQQKLLIPFYAFFGMQLLAAAAPHHEPSELSADEIVERVLAIESEIPDKSDYLVTYEEKFPLYEKELRTHPKEMQSKLTYTVAGPLSYLMTVDEMKAKIKDLFRTMRLQGKILTKDQFKQLDTSKWFKKGNGLDRIWGAQHLAGYKVPKYLIVVDNLDDIAVTVYLSDCFPILSKITNGTIYAEFIPGYGVAHRLPEHEKQIIQKITGYTDFSGNNNILRTSDGQDYFVDTEYKSFYDGMPENYTVKDSFLCKYMLQRFKLLNNIDADTIPVTISLPVNLFDAVSQNNIHRIQELIAQKAPVNEQDERGYTSLMMAAFFGNKEAVKLLLQAGAIVNKASNAGTTALMLATNKNHPEIVEILLRAGANPSAKNAQGRSALDMAKDPAIKEMLEKHMK